ncbi:MAG: hypothetical protein ACOYN4_12375 [Bacteroidales bacterium]
MSEHILSKSTYIRGLQCHKSLYLNKFRPYLRDKISEEQLAKFARGHAVGKVAQQLFPGGTTISRPGKSSALKTEELIKAGFPVIYEACFISDNVIVALDILVKQQNGYNAYEVKSSLKLSEVYYNDAFLQYHVLNFAGLKPEQFYLVHRNSEIELNADVELEKMFVFTDVSQLCEEKEAFVQENIASMVEALKQDKSPNIQPGIHCMKPYPCDFRGVCWKKISQSQQNELLSL